MQFFVLLRKEKDESEIRKELRGNDCERETESI